MAIDFPNSPTDGQVYTVGGRSWIYSTANGVWTANFSSQLAFITPLERGNIVAAAPSATNHLDVNTSAVWYHTVNCSANWTTNFRGSSGQSLDSLMAVGDVLTVTHLVTNGATPYYPSAYTIDGSAKTPKWVGGTAPTSGDASAINLYGYTIIKTAAATFTLLASVLKIV
jgi:hypothetical protein